MQSETSAEAALMRKVLQVIRNYSGLINSRDQYECDIGFLPRFELDDMNNEINNALNGKYNKDDFVIKVIFRDILASYQEELNSLPTRLTYLERYHKLDSALLDQLSSIRRQIFEIGMRLPVAIQLVDYYKCIDKDIRYEGWDADCHYS